MPRFDDLLNEFPDDSRRRLRVMWDALPAPMQTEVQRSLGRLPGDVRTWRMLMGLALSQYKVAFGKKHTVAIVGPANVGKSTLYNQLIQNKADQATVAPTPGTTRENQLADAGLFSVIDTPGADAVGAVGEQEKDRAFAAAQQADFLLVVFDATQGIRRSEQELFREFAQMGRPLLVVLNKLDLVRRAEREVVRAAAANLGLQPEQVLAVSARTGAGLDQVLMAIAKTEPEMVVALSRALPDYRWRLAWSTISGAASTAAVIALTPLPIVDVIPLLAVQSWLVLGVARIYQYEITPARARELVVTFGLGFLGRTLFQELSKLGGPPGWLLAAAIAAATTVVMGYAAVLWFERGERLTDERLRALTQTVTHDLLARLRSLGQKRPGRQSLRERVAEALRHAPPTLDPSAATAPAAPEPPPPA